MKALISVKGCTPLLSNLRDLRHLFHEIHFVKINLLHNFFILFHSFGLRPLLQYLRTSTIKTKYSLTWSEVGRLYLSKCCFDHIFIIKNIWKDSLNTLLLLLCCLILTLSYQDEFGFVSQGIFWTKVGRVQAQIQITSRMLTIYGPNTDSSVPNSVSFFPSQREKWSDITSESGL